MPSFQTLEDYARRVEEEMSPGARAGDGTATTKKCPDCATECALGAATCDCCGHEFPARSPRFRACDDCGALNPVTVSACQTCGASFDQSFTLTLDEALRTGVIVRGMDVDESDTRLGEQMAPAVRERILSSGDRTLVNIMRQLPEESWSRLRAILEDAA
jgi:hypothetical protein